MLMLRVASLVGALCVAAALMIGSAGPVAAHDIPNDVTVHAFFKPADNRAHLLIRVPLKAMRDVTFPERDGFLDLARVDPMLADAATVWIAHFINIYEGGAQLPPPRIVATHVSLESDRSFSSYESALAHVTGPKLPEDTLVVWNQVMLDVLFEYAIISDRARFSIDSSLARLGLRVTTALRFVPPTGEVQAYEYEGSPGLLQLDPRWHQAALQFLWLGFVHILDGTDHLLFVLCLVIPFRQLRPLILIVTSFTIAHSITLIAAAYNIVPSALWFPPLIETLIAVSIVYMALENIVGAANLHRRWIAAFAFGLVHGFGFSFMLRDTLQFAGAHMLTSLLSFNLGVELGQLLVVIVLIPALELLFRYGAPERIGTIIISALVAHTAWHWIMDRGSTLRQFDYQWPTVQTAAEASRLLAAIVLVVALIWALVRGYGALRGKFIKDSGFKP